jgi:hypothetical protein
LFPLRLTALASPCRAGDGRSGPPAAKRWRRSASLDGMTPVRPTRARQVKPPRRPISQPKPAFASKTPIDAATIAPHCAGDVLTDTLIEVGCQGTRPEPRPSSPIKVSIIAKRPLARSAEPTSLPLTYSPAWGGRNVSVRAAAISEPNRHAALSFDVDDVLSGHRNSHATSEPHVGKTSKPHCEMQRIVPSSALY